MNNLCNAVILLCEINEIKFQLMQDKYGFHPNLFKHYTFEELNEVNFMSWMKWPTLKNTTAFMIKIFLSLYRVIW